MIQEVNVDCGEGFLDSLCRVDVHTAWTDAAVRMVMAQGDVAGHIFDGWSAHFLYVCTGEVYSALADLSFVEDLSVAAAVQSPEFFIVKVGKESVELVEYSG